MWLTTSYEYADVKMIIFSISVKGSILELMILATPNHLSSTATVTGIHLAMSRKLHQSYPLCNTRDYIVALALPRHWEETVSEHTMISFV